MEPSSLGFDVVLHRAELLHDLGVGAAVERALQGAHRPGDGAVGIRPAGGEGPADEGGVVAAAVLGVDHQHHVQQVGLLLGMLLSGRIIRRKFSAVDSPGTGKWMWREPPPK